MCIDYICKKHKSANSMTKPAGAINKTISSGKRCFTYICVYIYTLYMDIYVPFRATLMPTKRSLWKKMFDPGYA